MGGKLAPVQSAVNYQLPVTLVSGFEAWVENVGATAILVTPPAGASFEGGLANVSIPPGQGGNFLATVTGVVSPRVHTRVEPLIPDDANTVSHVLWTGDKLLDLYPNAWVMNGAVPQVKKDGLIPPGAGPFSFANYYSLGAGADALDFAGDFSCAVLFVGSRDVASNPIDASNDATAGWRVNLRGGSNSPAMTFYDGLGAHNVLMDVTDQVVPGMLNVWCGGRSGANAVQKLNLGLTRTAATGSTAVAAVASPTRIGVMLDGTTAVDTALYELWVSATTPSDALFTAIAKQVRQKLNILAW